MHFRPKIWHFFKKNNNFSSGNFENRKVSKYKYPQICVKMRFQIPNNTKFYEGVCDTNTNSTKYTSETPNNSKYKLFWLFGTPNWLTFTPGCCSLCCCSLSCGCPCFFWNNLYYPLQNLKWNQSLNMSINILSVFIRFHLQQM